jgi:dihydroneopterin aldolase
MNQFTPSTMRGRNGALARPGLRHVFVRDLVLTAFIGIYAHEKRGSQRVRFNIDCAVFEDGPVTVDTIDAVVCYEQIILLVKDIVARGHVGLLEVLAEQVAAAILDDARIHAVRLRIEKLDVFPEAASVGIEIERVRG